MEIRKWLVERPRLRWLDYIEDLSWDRLRLRPKCSPCWWIKKCDGLIPRGRYRNFQGKAGEEESRNAAVSFYAAMNSN